MKYTYNKKVYNIPDEEIDKLVDTWEISINEACEMWLSDNDKIKNETVEEMTKKASKNAITQTIHGAKGEKKERKPREKKENPLKKQIISAILEGIKGIEGKIEVENDEKYINLWVEGRSFTINLVEHREKKEKKA
jgi:hypothetical protein